MQVPQCLVGLDLMEDIAVYTGSGAQIDKKKRAPFVFDEDIPAVQIQMDNVLLVDLCEDAGQVDGYFQLCSQGEFFSVYMIPQVLTVDIFQDQFGLVAN